MTKIKQHDDNVRFLLDEEKLNRIAQRRPVRRKNLAKIVIMGIAMWIVSISVAVAVVAALITLLPIMGTATWIVSISVVVAVVTAIIALLPIP